MTDALEEAALSGALFQPRERSGTPTRSDDDSESGSEPDSEDGSPKQGQGTESSTALIPEYDDAHSKGAQTGIKGVLNDKKAHTRSTNTRHQEEQKIVRERLEKMTIVGNTWQEEEVLRKKEKEGEDGDGVDDWRKKRMEEMKLGRGLREVGKEGFVGAVERAGWVVVLIYEPDIPRCHTLLQAMTALSATLQSSSSTSLSTPVTLLRARATTLSFSLLPSSTTHHDRDQDEEEEEPEADPDVLPTILAYKDGELERNWIRVDWEIGDGTLEELLRREGILPAEGYDDRVPT